MPGVLWTKPQISFPLADCASYPFTLISHSPKYNYRLSHPRKSLYLVIVLATSDKCAYKHVHVHTCIHKMGIPKLKIIISEIKNSLDGFIYIQQKYQNTYSKKTELKGETDKSITTARDFNTPPTVLRNQAGRKAVSI